MEEIEILSFATLDALKKRAKIVEKVGSLESGAGLSIFCKIEDDLLELYYNDLESNYIRRYEDDKEFQIAIKKRKEEMGEEEQYEETGEEEYEEEFEEVEYTEEDHEDEY
ncbi:MAG: hypothetical protein AB1410_10045 [Acidobacteriota bacterium]